LKKERKKRVKKTSGSAPPRHTIVRKPETKRQEIKELGKGKQAYSHTGQKKTGRCGQPRTVEVLYETKGGNPQEGREEFQQKTRPFTTNPLSSTKGAREYGNKSKETSNKEAKRAEVGKS